MTSELVGGRPSSLSHLPCRVRTGVGGGTPACHLALCVTARAGGGGGGGFLCLC